MIKKGILRIGTSGIVVPGNRASFPDEFRDRSRLAYYSSLFNSLEVNSTFRKIPKTSTFEKWSSDTSADFSFTIKVWQEVTHVKKLEIDTANIDLFFSAINYIGDKKGCLLIQFPGSITSEYILRVEKILQRIQELDYEDQWRKAVEFRNTSWYVSEVYNLLSNYDAAVVLHDMPKSNNLNLNEEMKFIYVRFHGPKGDYRGSYSNDFLEEQARKIKGWLNDGKDVYVYFNNTMGNAFQNAMFLKETIEK